MADLLLDLPTIKASELVVRATQFAQALADELERLNKRSSKVEMSQEDKEYLGKKYAGSIPGPTPKDYIPEFEAAFCQYMASQRVILPE